MGTIRLSNGRPLLRTGMLAIVVAVAAAGVPPDTGATAMSVVNLPNQVVIQRLNGARLVPVGYNITGPAGTLVEARAVNEDGSAATAWLSVGTSVADGTGAGSILVPEGGMYKLQVRPAGSQAIVATTTTVFGVGAVIGASGQSNMKGFFEGTEKYPTGYEKAFQFNGTGGNRVGNTSDTIPANSPSGTPGYPSNPNNIGVRADGPVYLANILALELGVPVMLVETYNPGAAISSWTTGTKSAWEAFKAKLLQAGGDMEAMYWYQGESNAATATKSSIETQWDILYSQALTLTGRTSNTFKMGMISLGPGSYGGSIEGQFGLFRVWQRDYSMNTPGWFFAGAAHACDTPSDGVHIDGTGTAYLGCVMPRCYLAVKGIGASGAGPYITGAARSGVTVTLAIAHSGGTALKDGAGGTGTALTGFRFFDAGAAGAQIGYTATAISGNSIAITLAAAPVGALTVDFAIMNAPHGTGTGPITYVPASAVFDNVTLPNRTSGCVLQPCAAMPVTGA